MDTEQGTSPDLARRIDALAARTSTTHAQIIEDALNGRPLAWQEEFIQRIERGIDQADRGEFVSEADMNALFDSYRLT